MNFPKRVKQHKAQSDSFAILLYKLKDIGIFRSATENDYGIDMEIEVVIGERVIGRYLKVQVKSSSGINVRKDGVPTISGIKQSTLLYWIELSYSSQVIACAVDLLTENIYISKPLFWQATWLLDKTNSTKTIEFLPQLQNRKDKLSIDIKDDEFEEFASKIQELNLVKFAVSNSISDIIFAHKTILRNFTEVFELYKEVWHYDAMSEVYKLDVFKTFLDCSKILIDLSEDDVEGFDEENKNLIFDFEYWAIKTNWNYDEVTNFVAQYPLKTLFPLLLKRIKKYSDYVIKGEFYWKNKDITYLRLVYGVIIPDDLSHDNLTNLGYETWRLINQKPFYSIINPD